MGCAICRWVYPGIIASKLSRACCESVFWFSSISVTRPFIFSIRNNLISVTTWSFLDLAVWSLPAIGPIISVSLLSIFIWISSSFFLNSNFPSLISFCTFFNPLTINWHSSFLITPDFASVITWAIDTSMSYFARR